MIRLLTGLGVVIVILAAAFMPALAQQLFVNQPTAGNAVMRAAPDTTSIAALLKKIRSGGALNQPVFVAASGKASRASLADYEPRNAQELKALSKILSAHQDRAFQEMKIASLARQAEMVRKMRFEDMRRQSIQRQVRESVSREALRAERAPQQAVIRTNAPVNSLPATAPEPSTQRPALFVTPGAQPVPKVFTDFR